MQHTSTPRHLLRRRQCRRLRDHSPCAASEGYGAPDEEGAPDDEEDNPDDKKEDARDEEGARDEEEGRPDEEKACTPAEDEEGSPDEDEEAQRAHLGGASLRLINAS